MTYCHFRCLHLSVSKCLRDGRLLCGGRRTKACIDGEWMELLPVEPRRPGKAFNTIAMAAGMIAARGR